MVVESSLELFSMSAILMTISQQKKTGILTVQGPNDVVAVTFLQGRIVAADSLVQTVAEGLSEILVSKGFLATTDLARVDAEQRATGRHFIDLIEQYLSRAQLLAALREQTMREIEYILRWSEGDFKFYSGDEVSFFEGFKPINVEVILNRFLDQTARSKEAPVVTLELVSPELIQALALHPELLKNLDWRSFERLLAQVLAKLGHEIELQRGTKDGGIDIIAVRNDGPMGPHRYLLQAKRWANAVDIKPVREILFLRDHYRVTKACLATTSRFTRGAWSLADEYKWTLELRDFFGIQEWLWLCHKKEEPHDT